MKKRFLFILFLCSGAALAHAATEITMTTNNQITCPGQPGNSNTMMLTSWLWGTSSASTTVSGIPGAGKLSLSQVTITKPFDFCTNAMLAAYFGETRLSTVVILQFGLNTTGTGTLTFAQLTLTNAYFVSYQASAVLTNGPTTETWTLGFDKICVLTNGQTAAGQSITGTTACYPET